jgi:hypothetical protein
MPNTSSSWRQKIIFANILMVLIWLHIVVCWWGLYLWKTIEQQLTYLPTHVHQDHSNCTSKEQEACCPTINPKIPSLVASRCWIEPKINRIFRRLWDNGHCIDVCHWDWGNLVNTRPLNHLFVIIIAPSSFTLVVWHSAGGRKWLYMFSKNL